MPMMSGDAVPFSAADTDGINSYSGRKPGLPKPRKMPKGGFRKAGKAMLKGGRRSSRRK